jgi:uncharacterized delta-60 repeat protein
MRYILLILLQFLSFRGLSQQVQNIVPDSTFSNDGLLLFNFFNNIDRGYGVAIQPDQKIIMVGLSKRPSTGFFELCFVRLNPDGTPDSSFNFDGFTNVGLGDQQSIGGQTPSVKLDNQGRIVALCSGGLPGTSGLDMFVCRLLPDGTIDNSFGLSGVRTVDMTGAFTQPDLGSAFDIDIYGNIYIVGACRVGFTPIDNDFALVKINSSGNLSNDFDQDGKKLFNPTGAAEFATGVVCLPNGRFIFGGKAGANVMLVMMDSTGALVNSFNGVGAVTIPGQSIENPIITLDSQGRILLGVSTSSGTIVISRYLQNGSVDATFGFNGNYVFNIGSPSVLTSIGFQSDQKIILGGYSGSSTSSDFLAVRLDSTGTLDLTFNSTGYKTQSIASSVSPEEANGMGIMNDDRILLAGTVIFSSAINEDLGMVMLKVQSTISTGIPSVGQVSTKIYPNPFDDEGINIELQLMQATSLRFDFYDVYGRLVSTSIRDVPSGANTINFSDFQMSSGVYTISIISGDTNIGNYKIVKK